MTSSLYLLYKDMALLEPQRVLSIDIGRGNYAVCALNLSPETVAVQRLELWRLGETKASPASQLIDRLLDKFRSWNQTQTWAPTAVLIEQQVRGAHINLALAFATYTYFKTAFPTAVVKFVHPTVKFKGYANYVTLSEIDSLEIAKHTNLSYTKRKRFAVDLAEMVLKHTGHEPLATLCTLCPGAKKDDLADAFLQSFCA